MNFIKRRIINESNKAGLDHVNPPYGEILTSYSWPSSYRSILTLVSAAVACGSSLSCLVCNGWSLYPSATAMWKETSRARNVWPIDVDIVATDDYECLRIPLVQWNMCHLCRFRFVFEFTQATDIETFCPCCLLPPATVVSPPSCSLAIHCLVLVLLPWGRNHFQSVKAPISYRMNIPNWVYPGAPFRSCGRVSSEESIFLIGVIDWRLRRAIGVPYGTHCTI